VRTAETVIPKDPDQRKRDGDVGDGDGVGDGVGDGISNGSRGLVAWEGERWLGTFVRHYVAPIIASPLQRRVIIGAFLALAGAGGWQASAVTKGLDAKVFLAKESVPYRYLTLSGDLFNAGADTMTIAAIGAAGGEFSSEASPSAQGDGSSEEAADFLATAVATDFAGAYELGLTGSLSAAADILIPGSIPPAKSPLAVALGLPPGTNRTGTGGGLRTVSGNEDEDEDGAKELSPGDSLAAIYLESAATAAISSSGAGSVMLNSTHLAQAMHRLVTVSRQELQGDVRFRRWRDAAGAVFRSLGPSVSPADIDSESMRRGDFVLSAWRSELPIRSPEDAERKLRTMTRTRAAVAAAQSAAIRAAGAFDSGSIPRSAARSEVVAFVGEFLWLERYALIDRITVQNLLLAGTAVLCSMMLFQPPRAAILTTAVVALTCVDIIGGMTVLGLAINVSTLVNLVMALGFACDYSAHVAQHFCVAQGTPEVRAAESLAVTGAAVANGGFSTLLATFVLAFSQSAGFVVLFKMFALMVGFGLLHGMVLLPLLLAELGPPERDMGGHVGHHVPGGKPPCDKDADSGSTTPES